MRALRVFFFEERRLGGIRLAIEAERLSGFDFQPTLRLHGAPDSCACFTLSGLNFSNG
jgi:hypothetical protein